MRIRDLKKFPPNSHPSPHGYPILMVRENKLGHGVLPKGVTLCAVGWLGSWNLSRGVTSEECIDRLFEAYPTKIISDGAMGSHKCEICFGKDTGDLGFAFVFHLAQLGLKITFEKFMESSFLDKKSKYSVFSTSPTVSWRERELQLYGHGHYLVKYRETVYMCPALILHYILDHRYKPPDAFVRAVIHGNFFEESDLIFVEIEDSRNRVKE